MNRYFATKKVKSTLSLKKTSALLSKVQIIILAGSIIQIPMLFLNLSEADSFRFAQTTLVVKQFMSFGFDLRMPLPIFGANSFLPFEFPIFQGVAALLGSVFNTSPLFAARLANENQSVHSIHEIKAHVGPFNNITWRFQGEPVEIEPMVKYYLTEFIKNSSR